MLRHLKQLVSYACLLIAAGNLASTARAELQVCNNTREDIFFAYTKRHTGTISNPSPTSFVGCQNATWDDTGWWKVQSCKCVNVSNADMRSQSIHWTAFGTQGGSWGSDSSVETWRLPFSVHNNCSQAVRDFCAINPDNACTTRGHWLSSSRSRGFSIMIKPNNTFSDGRSCADTTGCIGIDLSNCH
jgi:uncharacterized membrane protein